MNKKLFFILTVISLSLCNGIYSQEVVKNEGVIYTGILNIVPDNFRCPLIGFINIANGNFNNFQVGFINSTRNATNGAQIGFINTTSGINGVQAGYINLCNKWVTGAQFGFINVALAETNGAQFGFVNMCNGSVDGAQFGFVNTVKSNINGLQAAFVNVVGEELDGTQMGFVNTTKKLNGVQLGFVNVVDTVEKGFPLGFVSLVNKGGYRAFGVYSDQMAPVNISYRIGIKSIYSTFVGSYNFVNGKQFSIGAGLGSIMPLNEKLYINPEIMSQSYINNNRSFQHVSTLNASLGYNLTDRLHLSAGPSFTWSYSANVNNLLSPYFWIYNRFVDARNNLNVGFRIGLNYRISQ